MGDMIRRFGSYYYNYAMKRLADKNKDGVIDEQEEALFKFSSDAQNMENFLIEEGNLFAGAHSLGKLNKDLDKKQDIAFEIYNWDTNDNGKIDLNEIKEDSQFSELLNIFSGSQEDFTIEELLNYRNLFDLDKDGEISDEEKSKFGSLLNFDKTGDYTKEQLQEILKKAISNDRGKLSNEEKAIFNKMKDGSIFTLKQTNNSEPSESELETWFNDAVGEDNTPTDEELENWFNEAIGDNTTPATQTPASTTPATSAPATQTPATSTPATQSPASTDNTNTSSTPLTTQGSNETPPTTPTDHTQLPPNITLPKGATWEYKDGVYVVTSKDILKHTLIDTYDDKGNILTAKTYDGETLKSSYQYEYTFDEVTGKPLTKKQYNDETNELQSTTNYTYDDKGNILTEKRSDKDGKLTYESSYEYTYGENGNILAKKIKTSDNYGILSNATVTEIECTYDDEGNMLTKKTKGNGWLNDLGIHEYTYDKNGNTLTHKRYWANGELHQSNEYTYDDNGNVLSDKFYTNSWDSKPYICQGTVVYTYDDKGNELSKKRYNKDGKLTESSIYTYDENGNKLTEKKFNEKGKLTGSSIYTYDENGNELTYKTYDGDGKLLSSFEYTYSENGKTLTYKHYYSSLGYTSTTVYTYDNNGKLQTQIDEDPWDTISNKTIRNYKDGKPVSKKEYENGRLIKEEKVNYEDGKPVSITTTNYNKKGKITSTTTTPTTSLALLDW